MDDYLTAKETAKILGVTRQRVTQLCAGDQGHPLERAEKAGDHRRAPWRIPRDAAFEAVALKERRERIRQSNDWTTAAEIAERLDVDRRRAREWARVSLDGEDVERCGPYYYFRRSAVDALID